MASVCTYLNFARETEQAFNFYKDVFGTEFNGVITRMGDAPPMEGMPALSEEDKKLIMHISLPIIGGHVLMGTDAPESMGFSMNYGNNVHIMVSPDTRAETQKLFAALAQGGTITQPLADQFWGDYFGSLTDKFDVMWMFNCLEK